MHSCILHTRQFVFITGICIKENASCHVHTQTPLFWRDIAMPQRLTRVKRVGLTCKCVINFRFMFHFNPGDFLRFRFDHLK